MRDRHGNLVRWNKLGSGGFNTTYVSQSAFEYEVNGVVYNQRWVLKIPQKDREDDLYGEMNAPERAVRLWCELNENYPAVIIPHDDGWMAPYLGDNPAADQQVTDKQIELFRQHRRVVVDGCGVHNFLSFNGEIVCVDVDAAVHIQSPTSKRILDEIVILGSKKSNYTEYWEDYAAHGMPKAVQMTKTLLYLQQEVPHQDIADKYITKKVLNKLHRYQKNKLPLTVDVLETLTSPGRKVVKEEAASPRFFAKAEQKQKAVELELIVSEPPYCSIM